MDDQRKRDRARQVEVSTGVAAGTVGGALGATKLRDEFGREHPLRLAAGEKRAARVIGARPAQFLARDRPGFKPLLAGATTAATAAGASKYRQHHDRKLAARKLPEHEHVTKRHNNGGLLGRVDQVDSKAVKLKNKVVPPRSVIAVKLADGVGQVKENVRRDLSKAYDPQEARRKRAKVVESAAASGGATAAGVAIHSRRQANTRFARSVGHEAAAHQSFRQARVTGDRAKVKLSDLAKPKGYTPRTTDHIGQALGNQKAQYRHIAEGRHEFVRAYSEGKQGHRLLRRANRGTLAAAGLGVIALGAREKARANRR